MTNFGNECTCPENFIPEKQFIRSVLMISLKICADLKPNGVAFGCNNSANDEDYNKRFYDTLSRKLEQYNFIKKVGSSLMLILNGSIETEQQIVGQYSENEIVAEEGKQIKPIKAFYRVGTTYVSILRERMCCNNKNK